VLILGYSSTASTVLLARFNLEGVSYGYDRVRFTAPVFLGDTVTVTYRVAEINSAKINSEITITRQDGTICLVATHILTLLGRAEPA
jgi:acyl dehydratase